MDLAMIAALADLETIAALAPPAGRNFWPRSQIPNLSPLGPLASLALVWATALTSARGEFDAGSAQTLVIHGKGARHVPVQFLCGSRDQLWKVIVFLHAAV